MDIDRSIALPIGLPRWECRTLSLCVTMEVVGGSRVSYNLGWPQTCFIAKFEHLILSNAVIIGYPSSYAVLEIKPKASSMRVKHATYLPSAFLSI